MSSTFVFVILLFFLVFLSPPELTLEMAGRTSSRVAAAMRPLTSKSKDYTALEPKPSHERRNVFRGREVKGCLPKGIRHSSAPSRYVNYHTFDATTCSSGSRHHRKP
uniref:Uncharacterized protein n=1 Tax=Nelumbo nucifera TaxID=4432 RepID=A0A822Y8Y6_NELNU|nr:TPA_asm: hypothetical protein HUJ06_030001 [Nelumbo nucifera]